MNIATRAIPESFEVITPGEDGWCDWIHPISPYLMKCCDCGLVHELQFEIVPGPDDSRFNPGESEEAVTIFRARRAIDQNQSVDAMIAEFKARLPGWWYSIGDCSVSCDASCGPDVAGEDAGLLRSHPAIFDDGFHADLAQPSTVVDALRDVMEQGIAARDTALSEGGEV